MRKKQPLVSVGIPTYNRPEGLGKTLEYITKQTHKNLEIIISDNCSPNLKVKEIAKKFQKKDKRIQYYRQTENIFGDNFVFIIRKSTGKYFMWAPDDDSWDKSYITSCLNGFNKSKNIILVCTECDLINSKTGKLMFTDKGISTIGLSPLKRFQKYKSILNSGKNIGAIFYGLYKRNYLLKTMPFKKVIASDHIMLAELCFYGEFSLVSKRLMFKKWGGGASESFKKTARTFRINNELSVNYPYFVRELYFQKIISQTDKLTFSEKIKLACWSLDNYLKQTKLLYFGMKVNKAIKFHKKKLLK